MALNPLDTVLIAMKTYDLVVIANKTICRECKNPSKSQRIAIRT